MNGAGDLTALRLLLAFVLPVWVVAGFVDYICHRRTHIERTTGWRESTLHALQLGEMGCALVIAALAETTAAVVLVCVLLLAAHEGTVYFDLRYAKGRRDVTALEQMTHSFLEIMPLAAILLLVVAKWPSLDQLLQLVDDPRAWSFDFTSHSLPGWYVTALSAAIILLGIVPYAEELWRCLRARTTLSPKRPKGGVADGRRVGPGHVDHVGLDGSHR